MLFCGYDDKGNLFVDTQDDPPGFYELPAGSNTFKKLALKQISIGTAGQVQWDGKHITIQDGRKPGTIYRFKISGANATWIGSTHLSGIKKSVGRSWIQNNTVIVPFAVRAGRPKRVGFWAYPSGGKAKSVLSKFNFSRDFEAATISIGSTQ
jgi:hypothetical protein